MKTAIKKLFGPRIVGLLKRLMRREQEAVTGLPHAEPRVPQLTTLAEEGNGTAAGKTTLCQPLRDKWKEVPASTSEGGRLFSADLLKMDDQEFLAYWQQLFAL